MLEYLVEAFKLKEEDLVPGGRYHNMHDLMDLVNPLSPKLENDPLPPITLSEFESGKSIFEIIDEGDKLLHFPYQSYDYVLRFFNEAPEKRFPSLFFQNGKKTEDLNQEPV